jgi:hypothetical protein
MTDTAGLRGVIGGLVAFAAEEALAAIRQAISLNPELRASAARDPDLTALREAGRLTTLLT